MTRATGLGLTLKKPKNDQNIRFSGGRAFTPLTRVRKQVLRVFRVFRSFSSFFLILIWQSLKNDSLHEFVVICWARARDSELIAFPFLRGDSRRLQKQTDAGIELDTFD